MQHQNEQQVLRSGYAELKTGAEEIRAFHTRQQNELRGKYADMQGKYSFVLQRLQSEDQQAEAGLRGKLDTMTAEFSQAEQVLADRMAHVTAAVQQLYQREQQCRDEGQAA